MAHMALSECPQYVGSMPSGFTRHRDSSSCRFPIGSSQPGLGCSYLNIPQDEETPAIRPAMPASE